MPVDGRTSPAIIVQTTVELASLTPVQDGRIIHLLGGASPGDSDGGTLFYDATSTAIVDNFLVYDGPDSNGRYRRIGGASSIADNEVTNAKLADMKANSIKMNNTGSTGDPLDRDSGDITEETSPASGDKLVGFLAEGGIVIIDVGNLPTGGGGEANMGQNLGGGQGLYKTKSGVTLQFYSIQDTTTIAATLDGANDEIDLNVIDDSITNMKLANMVANSFKGRTTGAGDPQDIIYTSLSTVTPGSGDFAVGWTSAGVMVKYDFDDVLYTHPNHTGDVTSVGDGATTIGNDVVTYAKMQNVSAASRLIGRGSAGGAGDPEEITLGTNLSMSGTTLNATGGSGEVNTASNVGTGQGLWKQKNVFDLEFYSLLAGSTKITIGLSTDDVTIDVNPANILTSTLNNDAGWNNYSHPNHTGDVTSSGDGATTIANDAVTYAKMQNVSAASRLIGRGSSGSGDPQEISLGTTLAITTTTLDVVPGNINTSDLNNDAGWNAYVHPNHTGDVTSTGDGATVIANDTVTYAKMQNTASASILLGRGDSGAGDPQEIALGTNLSMSGTTLNAAGGGAPGPDSITNTELANMAAWTVKMRNANSTGDPQDVAAAGLTEEQNPEVGDWVWGWLATGELRKYDATHVGPMLNVKAFGATGDGSTDDTTAIQNAMNAADGREVYLPEGEYVVDGLTWNEDNDLKLTGPGVLLVAGNDNGIEIDMPLGSAQTINTVADANGSSAGNPHTVTQLTFASAHGLVVGDVIKIIADDTYGDVKSITSIVGEIAVVNTVVDSTNVRLNKQLESISTSATTPLARKLSQRKVTLDIRVDESGAQVTPHSASPYYVRVSGAIGAQINIQAKTAHHNILSMDGCFGGTASVVAQEADDDEANNVFGYGIRVGGATVGLQMQVNGGPYRHAVTTKDADGTTWSSTDEAKFYAFGRTVDCLVHDSVCIGAHRGCFDTHPLCQRWTFDNCHAIHSGISDETSASLPIGFQLRGRDLTLRNCSSTGGRGGVVDISMAGNSGDWFTRIENCDFRNNRLRAVDIGNNGWVSGDDHTVYLSDSTLEARSLCMLIQDADVYVDNCEFRYTGFSHVTQIDSANRTSTAHLNNCRWNHTTNNGDPSLEVNSGTLNLRIRNADTFLAANLGAYLIDVGSGATCNVDVKDWTYNNNRTIDGLIGGSGTVGTLASNDATNFLPLGNVTGATTVDMTGMYEPTITLTLTGDPTFTFNDPVRPCRVKFIITNDGSAPHWITWPSIIGPTPQIDLAGSAVSIVILEFDGTNYHHFGTPGS